MSRTRQNCIKLLTVSERILKIKAMLRSTFLLILLTILDKGLEKTPQD